MGRRKHGHIHRADTSGAWRGRSPKTLEKLEQEVKARIDQEVGKGVEWVANYAILGPYDYLDILRAPDVETAMKVATIVRTFGHAHTEVWAATEWKQFK